MHRPQHAQRHRASMGAALAAVCAAAAALALAGCGGTTSAGGGPSGTGQPAPRDLGKVEVREYKGEKLGTVADFRENSIEGVQYIDRNSYRLAINGAVEHGTTYSYGDIVSREATYTKVVQLDCVEGWSVKVLWEGVLLSDLIDRATPKTGAVTVIFHCYDGYTTSLPLAYIRDHRILMAYRMNGIEVPPERGFPFVVVAENKWGYKWAKWVTAIELSNDALYRGFWESRGYARGGDLDKPFFGQ